MKRRSLFLLLLLIPMAVLAVQSVSKSFTDAGTSAWLLVRNGDNLSYSVSGTFVGTVHIERTRNGGLTWDLVTSSTKAASGSLKCETPNGKSASYRVRCSTYTSGTIVTSLSEVDGSVVQFSGPGKSPVLDVKNESALIATWNFLAPNAAPRTNVTPPAIYSVIVNTAVPQVCWSTGTVKTSWCVFGSSYTACSN